MVQLATIVHPLYPIVCKVIIHKKAGIRHSWNFRGNDVWKIGVSLEQYFCQLVFARVTLAVQVFSTVAVSHQYITQPTLIHTDRTINGMNPLLCDLTDAPTVVCDAQLVSITKLHDLFQRWDNPSQASISSL